MNLNGSAIIAKKRATDPELKSDVAALLRKSKKHLEKREAQLKEKRNLVRNVRDIKRRSIEGFEETLFKSARKMGEKGMSVFIAKKPVDVAEYIRGFVGDERVGIVPSPQTIEAEVMQAFFMSNRAKVLSEKYAGQESGLPMIHPYFPYPREHADVGGGEEPGTGENTPKGNASTGLAGGAKRRGDEGVKHAIISAIVMTENGNIYVESEEMDTLKRFREPFVIVTADRIFPELDADKVEHLMEVSSGGAIKAEKTNMKGHLIILDNGRVALARNGMGDALMCINCYACSLYCPVYLAVGGLFGSPMMAGIGAVSVAYQSGLKAGVNRGLYYCTLCRRCEVECPMRVPITELIQKTRRRAKFADI